MSEVFARPMPLVSRLRHVAAALMLTCTIGVLAAQRAAADTPPVESISTSSLPSDYDIGYNWQFNASACGSESCVAVGEYDFANTPQYQNHGLIVPITEGVAGAGIATPLPNNVATDTNENDSLEDVSCWSAGSCVAVGDYTDSNGNLQALVLPITNGVPGAAEEVTLPGDQASHPDASLFQVSCSASGDCVAVGGYRASGGFVGLVVAIHNGIPANGVEVLAPASSSNPTQDLGFEGVSCQSDGSCTAVGYFYYDATDTYYAGMVVPIRDGVPGPAEEVSALPSGVSEQDSFLSDVSCPGVGTCSAIGYYNSYGSALVVPITGGVPGQATAVVTPDAQPSGLRAVSCQSSSSCFAVGTYRDPSHDVQPLVVPISNGVPATGIGASLPNDAEGSGQDAELYGLSCPASGSCLATGYYLNGAGNQMPLIASLSATSDGTAVTTALPGDAAPSSGFGGEYDTPACAVSSCIAPGDYNNAAGNDEPFVLSAQSPLTVSTTSLPGGAVGTAYSQTLTAVGAWGSYSWSVTSGSLPAGLGLNTQTGVISGTPTAGETSTFTVTATGTGAPAQTASQSYSVAITAPPAPPAPPATPAAKPSLKLGAGSATVAKSKFQLKLVCSVAACSGSLKLQIGRTVLVKHGKKKVRKRVTVEIGGAGFSLAAGQSKSVNVTLNAAGRRALGARHRLSVTVLDTMAGVKQTLGHVTLKPSPVKHKKKHG